MKELSIEEKAKRYDEAYKKVAIRFGSNVADEIFPEFKESEDERMRNAAINACKYMVDNFENSTKQYEDAIAWLERQGEQKPAEWSEKDGEMRMKVLKYLSTRCNVFEYEEVECWFKSLKDRVQSKQEWSEEDNKMLNGIIYAFQHGWSPHSGQIDWLKSLRPQSQWKPSDEQMEAVKSAALDVAKFSSRSEQLRLENEPYYKALVSLYNDLKKLREE